MIKLRPFIPITVLFFLLLLLLAACNPAPSPGPACTEIGCSNELRIVVDGPLPSTYTIDLDAPGAETISLTCGDGQSSEASIHECRPDLHSARIA